MLIAAASSTLHIHDFPSGDLVHKYSPGSKIEGPIRSLSWSKEGQWLAVVPQTGQAEILTVKSDQIKCIHRVQDIEEPSCAAFQRTTKKHLAVGTKNGLVLIYDIKSRSVKKRFPRWTSGITQIDFSVKDSHVAAACKNGEVIIYSNINNTLVNTLKIPHSSSVSAIRCHNQKRSLIAGGSNEGIVTVWDTNVSKTKFVKNSHQAPVTCVGFSPVNDELVVSAGLDRQFFFYDIVANAIIAKNVVDNHITSADFSPDSVYLVLGSQNGNINVYDMRKMQEPVKIWKSHNTSVKNLLFQVPTVDPSSSTISLEDNLNELQIQETTVTKNKDSFGICLSSTGDKVDGTVDKIEASDNNDSFMVALGLDKNKTQEESPKRDVSEKNLKQSFLQNSLPRIACERLALSNKMSISTPKNTQMIMSTPRTLELNTPKVTESENCISPIIRPNIVSSTFNVTSADIQKATKDAVTEEMKGLLEKMKEEIVSETVFKVKSNFFQMQRLLFSMQVANVKEFSKLEETISSLRDIEHVDLNSYGNISNEAMIQENIYLKRRVQFLEEQLANNLSQINGNK